MADSFIVNDFSADDFDDVFGDKQQTVEKAKPVTGNDSQQADAWSAPETISDDTGDDPWQAEPLNNNANEESELDWFAETDTPDNGSADSNQDAWSEDSFADIWSDIDTETPTPSSQPKFNENDSQQASGGGEDDWFTELDGGQEPVIEPEPEPEPEPAIETLPAPQPLPETSTTSDDEDDGWFDEPEPAVQSADTDDTGEGLDDPWASPTEWEETPSTQSEQATLVEESSTEVIEPVTPVSEPPKADNADSEDNGWFDDTAEAGWATENEPQTEVIQPVESKPEPASESEDDWFTEPVSETAVNAPQNDVDADWDTWADEPTETDTTPVEDDTAPHAGGFLQTDLTDDARQMENWLEPVTPENNEQPSSPKKTKTRHLPQKRTIIIAGGAILGIIALAGIGVGIKNVITKTQHDKQVQQAEANRKQADSEAQLSYANARGKADKLIKSIQDSPVADDEELKNGVTGLQDTLNDQHPHTRAEYQASAKTITTAISPLQKTYTDKMTAKANEVSQRLGDLIGRANGLSTAPDSDSKTHMQSLVEQWGGKKITADNVARAIATADSLQSDVDSVQRSVDDANAQNQQAAPVVPAPAPAAPAPAPAPKKQATVTPKKPAPAAPKQTTTPRNQAPAPARPAPAPAPNNGGSSGGNTGVNIG